MQDSSPILSSSKVPSVKEGLITDIVHKTNDHHTNVEDLSQKPFPQATSQHSTSPQFASPYSTHTPRSNITNLADEKTKVGAIVNKLLQDTKPASIKSSKSSRSSKDDNLVKPIENLESKLASVKSSKADEFVKPIENLESKLASVKSSKADEFVKPIDNLELKPASIKSSKSSKADNFVKPIENHELKPASVKSSNSSKADEFVKPIENLELKPASVKSSNSRKADNFVNPIENLELKPASVKSSKSSKADNLVKPVDNLEVLPPQRKNTSDDVDKLLSSSNNSLSRDVDNSQSNGVLSDIDKIAKMSKALTNEAQALRKSIKSLSMDITQTRQEFCKCEKEEEDVNFPYHLFLVEIIINKIHMKCECLDIDSNNLVISATFLGKQPITVYDSSFGKIENFNKLNVGKSILFAMTYDKISSIKEFEIVLHLTSQPPCSSIVTKIGETHMDYTSDFIQLRKELCTKWREQQPTDNILCTTSTPLTKNMYYLSCGDGHDSDSVGIIEVTVRMSFLGKEITTAFCAKPKPKGTAFLLKEDHGMTMYSCQRVEMDEQGKILLDESVVSNKTVPCIQNCVREMDIPHSPVSSLISKLSCERSRKQDRISPSRYDEIYTKMNVNELKIRVPKTTKIERLGKYDKVQELCLCESSTYNSGEQIQFDLPRDNIHEDKTYTSNLKYSIKNLGKSTNKDRKTFNVTPTDCPVPVEMSKELHPRKDVFILKIGKKLETQDKKTDLEIELITPKAPSDRALDSAKNISAQCSCSDVKKEVKKSKAKGKKGKGDKAKKSKGKKK